MIAIKYVLPNGEHIDREQETEDLYSVLPRINDGFYWANSFYRISDVFYNDSPSVDSGWWVILKVDTRYY